jgi:multidrug transporter EmrE-like cation transporter
MAVFFDGLFINLILLSVWEIFGDFNLRWYAQSGFLRYLILGVLGYIGVITYAVKCFMSDNVLYVNGMWDGMSAILESIAAYVILGDRLKKPMEYVGLLLTIVGIFLMKH